MVVIAIIAILAAMLLPALSKAREKARGISCVNDKKTIGLGETLYSEDFEGFMIYSIVNGQGALQACRVLCASDSTAQNVSGIKNGYFQWTAWCCPSASYAGPRKYQSYDYPNKSIGTDWGGVCGLFPGTNGVCDTKFILAKSNYSDGHNGTYDGDDYHGNTGYYYSLNILRRPTEAILAGDTYLKAWPASYNRMKYNATDVAPAMIHGDRCAIVYFDGHASQADAGEMHASILPYNYFYYTFDGSTAPTKKF